MITTLLFAFLAGLLSLLSPCTLPLLPIIVATALGQHRFGPFALAAGLGLSFAAMGLLVALAGHSLGLNEERIRGFGALLLIGAGVVLLSPRLQTAVATLLEPLVSRFTNHGNSDGNSGLASQFAVGLLLGIIWSPCVGPTLGAASLMAARGENLGQVTATMLVFGIGAGLPLAAIGLLPAGALSRARNTLAAAGRGGRILLGLLLLVTGAAVLTGFDKRAEAAILNIMPQWLVELTARF